MLICDLNIFFGEVSQVSLTDKIIFLTEIVGKLSPLFISLILYHCHLFNFYLNTHT